MRRRTVATIAVGATASLVAGGVALAQVVPGGGPLMGGGAMSGGAMSGGMMNMMGGRGMPGMMGTRSGAAMGTMSARDGDQWFIQEMIPHHEDAVVMADFAPLQAEHSELESLAQQITSTQTREIAQMRAWYQAWYGTADVPPGQMDQMHDTMGQMRGMMSQSTGLADRMGAMHAGGTSIDGVRPFDKAFIEHMIPHHQMAVMMAGMVLGSTTRPELRQLLQSIITSQSAEIAQMRTWYQAWYG